jgi:hypothetical protein
VREPPSLERALDSLVEVVAQRYDWTMAQATDPKLNARRAAIEYARGIIADLAPGRSLADELIAERHAEAAADTPVARRGDSGNH